MTIIAALHEKGVGTWIAGDTLVCSEYETVGFNRKWVVKNNAALGLCGSNVTHAIIEDAIEFDATTKPIHLFRDIVKALRDADFKPKAEEGSTPIWDFAALFATPYQVVGMNGCGSIVPEFIGGFAAKGSGANYAEGAAWALARSGFGPREIIEGAVAAAMAHCRGCGGELWVDCLRITGAGV